MCKLVVTEFTAIIRQTALIYRCGERAMYKIKMGLADER